MQLIIVTKTNYGYRAETASKSLPNEKQTKRIDAFIKHSQMRKQTKA